MVGSKSGEPEDPAWFTNLRREPGRDGRSRRPDVPGPRDGRGRGRPRRAVGPGTWRNTRSSPNTPRRPTGSSRSPGSRRSADRAPGLGGRLIRGWKAPHPGLGVGRHRPRVILRLGRWHHHDRQTTRRYEQPRPLRSQAAAVVAGAQWVLDATGKALDTWFLGTTTPDDRPHAAGSAHCGTRASCTSRAARGRASPGTSRRTLRRASRSRSRASTSCSRARRRA